MTTWGHYQPISTIAGTTPLLCSYQYHHPIVSNNIDNIAL